MLNKAISYRVQLLFLLAKSQAVVIFFAVNGQLCQARRADGIRLAAYTAKNTNNISQHHIEIKCPCSAIEIKSLANATYMKSSF